MLCSDRFGKTIGSNDLLCCSGSPLEATIYFTRLAGTRGKTQVAGAIGLAVAVSFALWAVQGSLSTVAALGMPLYDHL